MPYSSTLRALPKQGRRLRDVRVVDVEEVLGLSLDELRRTGVAPFVKKFGADDPGELLVKVPAQLCALGAHSRGT